MGVTHFETILEEIGVFGKWQKKLLVLLWIPSVFCGIAFMTYSFAMGTPANYRCHIPECDNGNDNSDQWNATWISSAIPMKGDLPSKCEMFTNYDTNCENDVEGNNLNVDVKACDTWIYDKSVYKSTVVTEFDLVCEKNHYKSAVGMINVVVYGISASMTGYFSDTYGRKLTILISVFLSALFNLISSFSTSYWMYIAFYWLSSLFLNGTYLAPYVITVELVGADYAAVSSILINFPFVLGELIMIVIAYFFRDFRTMLQVAFIPTFIILIIGFWIPESPRWLLVNGKLEKAKKILTKGAAANGVKISSEKLDELIQGNKKQTEESVSATDIHLWSLLMNPCMRKRLIIMYINFVAVVLCYSGLTLNGVNLKGSIYMNMALGVFIEIPSYLFCVFTLDRFGRRPIVVFTNLVCGICSFLVVLVPQTWDPWVTITLATVAKFGTTAAFTVVLLQVLELFPTSIRNTSMGSCSFMSRIGGILAPLVTNLGPGYEWIPFSLFALTSILAGMASVFLPETKGIELPATIEEAEEYDNSPTLRQIITCGKTTTKEDS